MSGVSAFVTSIRSTKSAGMRSTAKPRSSTPVLPLALRVPSTVTAFMSAPMPRIDTAATSPSRISSATPGRRMSKLPMFWSAMFPKASAEITFFTLAALRCWVIASALPSRSPATVNFSIA